MQEATVSDKVLGLVTDLLSSSIRSSWIAVQCLKTGSRRICEISPMDPAVKQRIVSQDDC